MPRFWSTPPLDRLSSLHVVVALLDTVAAGTVDLTAVRKALTSAGRALEDDFDPLCGEPSVWA
ncbi:hypothetical protein ACQP06_18905 [Nocardia sp. CA-136227]|uniref:hypothetical protein n=1 Tax=Nocardia sp. CA-136227 TaxID=3239979 RepID=UPI003D98195E